MPCLFERDFSTKPFILLRTVTPGCEWVIAGEGIATRKFDGTACAVIGGVLYARYDCKKGKTPPEGAIPCCSPDPVTGHWPHWVKVEDQPQFKWHKEALWHVESSGIKLADGTYELCGPKVGRNPEKYDTHTFVRHGGVRYLDSDCPRSFDGLREFFSSHDIEGIVFHHPDGRMVKIRKADYGMTR